MPIIRKIDARGFISTDVMTTATGKVAAVLQYLRNRNVGYFLTPLVSPPFIHENPLGSAARFHPRTLADDRRHSSSTFPGIHPMNKCLSWVIVRSDSWC